ncbi:hypothetical protein [Roseovarius sp. EL26]|uniref:hypothetical protein n=1 Tax=Roseovarius sp. EL26 TaxID=2126672 RepID=UPI0020B13D3B|nr:hypothetical protein [Roseovarius sp. EL26]
MIPRLVSALLRAMLVALLIAAPSLLLVNTGADTAQVVVVLAILASVLTFIEYYGRYPSFIEFRFAAPVNRLKFTALLITIVLLSLILRGQTNPTGWTTAITNLGDGLGRVMDFPYSPVRLVLLMLPPETDAQTISLIRTSAGIAYMVSFTMMFVFLSMVRLFDWPVRKGAFNVWINLPLFDPTRGDVLERLKRDASLNLVLGFLLPFFIPFAVNAASSTIDPLSLNHPQTLIWTITAWAFLPASLLMRGIAISRIAGLIEEKRRRAYAQHTDAKALQSA